MPNAALKQMTLDEFLVWDDGTDRRYELIDGEVVAMAPPSSDHAALVIALGAEISNRLKPPCRIFGEGGVTPPHRRNSWYQADIAVSCTPRVPGRHAVGDPVVIIEVLSPSTASHDGSLKLADYQAIPSVMDILLVAQDRCEAEHWHHAAAGWASTSLGPGDAVDLPSIGVTFALAAAYERAGIPLAG